MVVELSSLEGVNLAELRKLSKERGITLIKGSTKVDYQIALRAWEEVCLLQATTQVLEDDTE